MGIFSRFRDIINSNINSMLDKAEDPEKLIRLMIQEMEDTLVEIKASTAAAIASKKKLERVVDEVRGRADSWDSRAKLAVDKGRDDLAREALLEKRRYEEKALSLEEEQADAEALIAQYQEDILKLEEKLAVVREKQRTLVQRHTRAQVKKRAEKGIRKAATTDAFVRFEQFANRVERLEAEAELINFGAKSTLDQEFAGLEDDDDIERELEQLKQASAGKASDEKKQA